MIDPIALCTAVACVAICLRLLTYERQRTTRFRPGVSACAWLLIVCTAANAVRLTEACLRPGSASLWLLGPLLVLLVLLMQARGNLARLVDFPQ
ncbi:phage holin family protein [Lysobacter arvi]|uniref:Phage holin family protein n=1 Tax=Lysobacter arvi TaxID=3038776 RepID=A0ABU1CCB0_9GAMM|nr:phage holin family protein [Lysobacter arvi]MDR0182402.1 phage holin family protein [Lysobacter arvi]